MGSSCVGLDSNSKGEDEDKEEFFELFFLCFLSDFFVKINRVDNHKNGLGQSVFYKTIFHRVQRERKKEKEDFNSKITEEKIR